MSERKPRVPAWAGQEGYDVRFQWGPVVAPTLTGGTCVVVDVLRFTTAVEAGAQVVAGCLRNAAAAGAWVVDEAPRPVTVIACGEKWYSGTEHSQ